MKIELQEALDLIESADVVKLLDGDGYITAHITTEGIINDSDNPVMIVSWRNDKWKMSLRVIEEGNEMIDREGHTLIFTDDEGEPFELHLFREVPILA